MFKESPKKTWLSGPTVCSQGTQSLFLVIRFSAYVVLKHHSSFPAPQHTPGRKFSAHCTEAGNG